MKNTEQLISLERDNMTDVERELFLKDMRRVIAEYFESDGSETLEITRSDGGFIVCVLFTARRIKTLRQLA